MLVFILLQTWCFKNVSWCYCSSDRDHEWWPARGLDVIRRYVCSQTSWNICIFQVFPERFQSGAFVQENRSQNVFELIWMKEPVELDCWHDSTNICVLFGIKCRLCWRRRKSHHAVRCLILVLYNRSHVFLFHPQCSLLSSACRLHPVTTTTYTTWTRQKVCVTCLTSPFSTSDLRDCRQSRKQLAQI